MRLKKIGEICEVKGGKRLPKGHELIDKPTNHRYIRAREIKAGKILDNQSVFVSDKTFVKIARYIVNKGDVVITIVGANVGDTAIIPEHLNKANLTENAVKLCDFSGVDSNYLNYVFQMNGMKEQMQAFASGSAQDKLGIYKIKELKIPFHSISTQKKIASILSAYVDLIENNNQRIQLLEEMVEDIYKEWFVRLRFPGYQDCKLFDKYGKEVPHGTVGALPEGWKRGILKDNVKLVKRGISPVYDENGETRVINQRCIRNSKLNLSLTRKQSKKIPKEKLIQFGDVLVNSTGEGTLGRVAQVYDNYEGLSVDSHVTIIRPSTAINFNYFGICLLSKQIFFENLAFGSTGQTELGREDIQKIEFVIAEHNLMNDFGNIVSPMRFEINLLLKKNEVLQETRDLLLPRLISGKLSAGDIELENNTITAMAAEPEEVYEN